MSDRINGLVVVFEEPMSRDDAERVRGAIRALRGVATVKTNTETSTDDMARVSERHKIGLEMIDAGRKIMGLDK
jgi:hypothetical protein